MLPPSARLFFKVLLALLLTAVAITATIWQHFLSTPLIANDQPPAIYQLHSGTTLRQMATELQQRKLLSYPNFFVLLGRLRQHDHLLKAGEYELTPGILPKQLLQKIAKGEVLQHNITLIEGRTLKQFITVLQANDVLVHEEKLLQAVQNLVKPAEGWFFPSTYQFPRGTSDLDILKSAHTLMQVQLSRAWLSRQPNLPYKSSYEALIVASLIEKETAIDHERPIIAAVILKRLALKMPLQIDAAVIYGLGDKFNGDITKKDLRRKTPYNTYRNRGLPPTPITMPSLASIKAALNPAEVNYLYFVATGDGGHHFSSNLKDHNAAVKKYQLGEQSPHGQ